MNNFKLLNIGFGKIILTNEIIAVVNPHSTLIKRLIQIAKENDKLEDITNGRPTRSVVITKNKIYLSSIQPETMANRLVNDEFVPEEE